MNDVLSQMHTLFETNMIGDFKVSRVQIGAYSDTFNNNSRYGDLAMILLEPGDEEMVLSNWANNFNKTYSVRVYIIMLLNEPILAQIQTSRLNQGKTLNGYTNEIIRLLGTDKLLSGKVRLQDDRFKIEQFTDKEGRQAKVVKLQYMDDLIPDASQTINQSDMIKQI